MADRNKTNELVLSCSKALQRMAEKRASVQNDVKHIVETFCEPFVEREMRDRKLRKRGLIP